MQALVLGPFLVPAMLAPVLADCGHASVTVVATAAERETSCEALRAVLDYFAPGGYAVVPDVTIQFQPDVRAELTRPTSTGALTVQVSGYYRASSKELWMVSEHSPWTAERRPWGLAWNAELGRSVLQHELTHAVIAQLMGSRYDKLPRSWHEALAYAVQIDLMPPGLRRKVLSEHPEISGFTNTAQINDAVYGLNPDAFAVAAYKTYVEEGRLAFLKQALALKVEVFDLDGLMP